MSEGWITEFDLVCDKSIYAWLSSSLLFFGWALGAIILGLIADKYGRRSVLFPSVIMVMTMTFIMSFVKAVWLILLLRVVVGIFEGGSVLTMFVLATELVGPAKRALSGTLVWFYFTFALMAIGFKAYFIRDWKWLCIVSIVPFVFVVVFWKFIPESVRWLLIVGRKDQAKQILEHVARVNKRDMPSEDIRVPVVPPNKGFLELFRTSRLALSTLLQCYAWFVNGMVYYGVSMSSGELGGSIYLNFVLTSLVEIPANMLVIDNCNRFGRKKTTIAYFVVGAIACVAVSFIPSGTDDIYYIVGRVTGGMLGKMCITVSFNSIYVFSAELFPTMVRNSGMGLMSVVSRVGAATAPFVVQLTRINPILPFALMGGLAFLASFACWFLPETNGKPTLEVIGDDKVHPPTVAMEEMKKPSYEERNEEAEKEDKKTNLGYVDNEEDKKQDVNQDSDKRDDKNQAKEAENFDTAF
ncbi:organic cation transporter protein-like isoform X2 [Actinia tenebrosa]|uniref:Organic cation transporter protein-like isoform X2 n=1 Tax=Actinia tenebrosa TaxID=6105 RepID=A0A6P8I1J1_ACTTE|nr:organic cation transporter protein-like isoform X2 [Actinia tenebrosa]